MDAWPYLPDGQPLKFTACPGPLGPKGRSRIRSGRFRSVSAGPGLLPAGAWPSPRS